MNRTATQSYPFSQPQSLPINPPQESLEPRFAYVLGFLLLHIPLGFLAKQLPNVGTLHALAVLALGLVWAVSPRRPLEQVAYVGAYIAGSEVLWRMTETRVPWEFGKYAVVFIFIVAMLRVRRLQGPVPPLLYFVLLLPAIILTVTEVDLGTAKKLISFNMSGPFALFISAWFFSQLKFSSKQRQHLFLAVVGPIVGIWTIVLYGILTAPSIRFTVGSNQMLSGGYGPNQISSVLALGVLMAFWYIFKSQTSPATKALMYGLMLLLLIQSILTFSRGGLYTAAGSFMLAAFFLIRDSRTLIKSIFGLTVFLLIVIYVLWPRLDAFTGGQLSARYLEEQRTSGRDTIVIADLEIWKAYPIYGVGPGMGKQYRVWLFNSSHPAHTEQTRMLAEHGLYGFVSLSMLLGMTIQRVLRASTPAEKAFTASVTGFCLLYMLHAAMRLVTPSFVFGMAYATFLPEENLQQPSENKTEEQPQIASRGYAVWS